MGGGVLLPDRRWMCLDWVNTILLGIENAESIGCDVCAFCVMADIKLLDWHACMQTVEAPTTHKQAGIVA